MMIKNKLETNVAVIMSVYINDNVCDFKNSVDSILNQDFSGVTLFIYVDGDVSKEVFSFLEIANSHVRCNVIFGEVNVGLAKALNYLIEYVLSFDKFHYIARMDSDDISYNNRISHQVNYMEQNIDVDVSGTFCSEFGSDFSIELKKLPTKHEELLSFSISRCPFIHPTVIFRSSVFANDIRYPENTSFTEDMGLWFLLLDKGFRFGNLPEVLLKYRLNGDTVIRRQGFNKAKSEFVLRFRYMIRLKQFCIKNTALVTTRLVFHFLPSSLLKALYKKLR